MAEPTTKKKSKSVLIKEFFELTSSQAIIEYKKLTDKDKIELASAAARALGYADDQLEFVPVAY